jgi:hypothetical protein
LAASFLFELSLILAWPKTRSLMEGWLLKELESYLHFVCWTGIGPRIPPLIIEVVAEPDVITSIFIGAAGSRGAASPMIHRLLTWNLPILAPMAVDCRFLGSVFDGMAVGRCVRTSRCGRPTSKSWDEPASLGDTHDGLGMTIVVVDRPQRWTHWSKWSQLHQFDQTDVSLINLIHPSCARGEGNVWDRVRGTRKVWPHLAGPTVPGGAAMPGSCGMSVPFPPEMCTCS